MCVCVCVYPGYVQSPGWDGRTLYSLRNLVGKNVTVKVPPQHQVMFSFKDVHMIGTVASLCLCEPSGVKVETVHGAKWWQRWFLLACDFIFLSPVIRDTEQMKVLVTNKNLFFDMCPISETGKRVHGVLFDYLPFDDDWYWRCEQKARERRREMERRTKQQRERERERERERGKLQALVYDILPLTTAVFSYAIGPENCQLTSSVLLVPKQ